MNHLAPRQRQADGRWDFTTANKRTGVCAIGYCGGWHETLDPGVAERLGEGFVYHWKQDVERLRPFKDKFHTDGHATKDEAVACHREFTLDTKRRDFEDAHEQRRCRVCESWTQHRVSVDGEIFDLCPEHSTREAVSALYPGHAESWES